MNLKREVGKNGKLASFRMKSPKFESFGLIWKVPSEVGKFIEVNGPKLFITRVVKSAMTMTLIALF